MNEDYDDLVTGNKPAPESAALWLFDRIDAARVRAGGEAIIGTLDEELRREIAEPIEDEARKLLDDKVAEVPDTLEGKTVVIEFARGGADGSPLPLVHPYGYKASLAQLSQTILAKASILYIWVTPEGVAAQECRAHRPRRPGQHPAPRRAPGGHVRRLRLCDMAYLLEQSDKPDTVQVDKDGQVLLPALGRFDNRVDKTTFIRERTGLVGGGRRRPAGGHARGLRPAGCTDQRTRTFLCKDDGRRWIPRAGGLVQYNQRNQTQTRLNPTRNTSPAQLSTGHDTARAGMRRARRPIARHRKFSTATSGAVRKARTVTTSTRARMLRDQKPDDRQREPHQQQQDKR